MGWKDLERLSFAFGQGTVAVAPGGKSGWIAAEIPWISTLGVSHQGKGEDMEALLPTTEPLVQPPL